MTAAHTSVSMTKQGRIATVSFAVPGPANALSRRVMRELTDVATDLERDAELSAVVLRGRPDVFTLGYDLRDTQSLGSMTLAQRREALSAGPRMCAAFERIEALTVVAIEGWCVGGGVALAAAFDLRVAGDTARFYVPEIERGMNMSWGSVPRLVNLLGPARAKRVVMLAEKLDARTAQQWGFVDEDAPAGMAFDRAVEFATRAAAMPPVQLRMCKAGINAYANALAASSSALDRDQYLLAQGSRDHAEGVRAFLEKRSPRYSGD